jgi:hypothetical protein
MKTHIGCLIVGLLSLALPMAGQVSGGGTPSRIPIWTSSTTLGDSIIFQTGVGSVGTSLQVTGGAGLTGQFGHNGWPGGSINLTGGHGGGAGTSVSGGSGGSVQITGGTGGSGTTCCAQNGNGNGGSITLQPGAGGTFVLTHGRPGNVILAPTRGLVGIRTTNPQATLDVATGFSTLADAWITRSARRFKTNIQPLEGALEKVTHLRGVSYDRKADGKHEIGMVAEDVDRVVPEVVSRNPKTKEVQGVDYSRLAALLIEAVKSQQAALQSQQAEIQKLKARIEQLTFSLAGQ